jgi:hypothetical protein
MLAKSERMMITAASRIFFVQGLGIVLDQLGANVLSCRVASSSAARRSLLTQCFVSAHSFDTGCLSQW